MLAKLARIILAFTTFPLVGAYGLRWVGSFVSQIIGATGVVAHPVLALDLIGGLVGLVLGLILAIQIVGCCVQPETSPVRPVGDTILIILGLTLVLDVALAKACAGMEWLRWLPAGSLVVWAGAAAATASLHRLRRSRRMAPPADDMPPPYPPPAPPPGPYSRP